MENYLFSYEIRITENKVSEKFYLLVKDRDELSAMNKLLVSLFIVYPRIKRDDIYINCLTI